MARKTKSQLRTVHLTDGTSVIGYDGQIQEEAERLEREISDAGPVQTSGMDDSSINQDTDKDQTPGTVQTSGTAELMPVTGLEITTSATTIQLPPDLKLKDLVLQDYTVKIADTINSAVLFVDEKNREVARMLADISLNKRYLADGFKSVAEYANKFFGYRKSAAYTLAAAGEVYLDPAAPEELKAFSPYKLAELSKADRQKVEAAAKSGEIKSTDTVKDLREKAQQLTADDNEGVVEKQYLAELVTPVKPMWTMAEKFMPIYQDAMNSFKVDNILYVPTEAIIRRIPIDTADAIIGIIKEMYLWTYPGKLTITQLPKIKSKDGKGKRAVSRETLRYCVGDGVTYMVLHLDQWIPPVQEPAPEKPTSHERPASEMTVEELLALAAQKKAEQEAAQEAAQEVEIEGEQSEEEE